MTDLAAATSVGAGVICLAAGVLARSKAPNTVSSSLFVLAMSSMFVAMVSFAIYPNLHGNADLSTLMAKVFAISSLLGFAFLFGLSAVYPYKRRVMFQPLNSPGSMILITVLAAIALGALASTKGAGPEERELTSITALVLVVGSVAIAFMTTVFVALSREQVDDRGKRAGIIFLAGIWVAALGWAAVVANDLNLASISMDSMPVVGAVFIGASGLIFAYSIAHGQMAVSTPMAEKLVSSSKSSYRLFLRYVYMVEEQKPDFSFRLFADILKGRCWDCKDDESFTCESLDCTSCRLPCPCKECQKYVSRPQGLIISRQFPNEIRSKYFLQTTPIVWLSTVAGKDNTDPAKLTLLTDFLVNFMENSHNGVVLVDGIEYLVTTNDFGRVIKAVDKWTESAMMSSSRLIITIDPRSFAQKELALLERNKEVVRPDAPEKWMIIPEPI